MTTTEASKKVPCAEITVRKWCQKHKQLIKQGPISAYDLTDSDIEEMRKAIKPTAGRPVGWRKPKEVEV